MQGFVTKVDDDLGLVHVRFAEVEALLDIADMDWARKPDAGVNVDHLQKLAKPSLALKPNDVIELKVLADQFVLRAKKSCPQRPLKNRNPGLLHQSLRGFRKLALEQEPIVQGSMISFDLKSAETVVLVGGYEFIKNVSEFNRALQAKRQTG